MANKIGRFEILSELSHSEMWSVYKATDPESNKTVALKAIKLELLGEQAASLVETVSEEAESTKDLSSPHIAVLYGAGEMEDQFCAALEYVQGNSIATVLARQEGFSIWDIRDIARQACQGLDHANEHKVAHYSLEPAKIMSQWDGTVKILGFGISSMGAYAAQATGAAPEILHYMSPEQLHGDPLDVRSNLFSLGAILYEMATERKAFDAEDADQVRQQILELTPPPPIQINPKTHPMLNDLIMKALDKDPEQRYQSGKELIDDLEKCKDSPAKAVTGKMPAPVKGFTGAPPKKPAAAQNSPFAGAPTAKPAPPEPAPIAKLEEAEVAAPPAYVPSQTVQAEKQEIKKAAAAAGASSTVSRTVGGEAPAQKSAMLDPTAQFISSRAKAAAESQSHQPAASMSSTVADEPEVTAAPKFATDPSMGEGQAGPADAPRSFSEISELPPLKEVYIAPPKAAEPPPAPEQEEESLEEEARKAVFTSKRADVEKPRIQPKEIAKKAATEIKKTPPKLFLYSIAGAVAVILFVIAGIAYHIHSQSSDDDAGTQQTAAPAAQPAPAPTQAAAVPTPDQQAAAAAAAAAAAPAIEPAQPEPSVVAAPARSRESRGRKKGQPEPVPAAAVVIPGQLTINTTPEGAQVQLDGKSDPGWATPYNMTGVAPGAHTVILSKAGFGSETRSIDVPSGSKSFLAVQLAPLTASVTVTSDPAGAAVLMDGKDTGKVTPAQLSVDKPGSHTFVVRKNGYLDETSTTNLQAGQIFRFAPTLRQLGDVDDIKVKKMFGRADAAGMGTISIKTQPKGAQIAVNNRILDKASPAEFFANPGTYEVDVTMSGFKDIHKVITVEKGGKVAIDEILERQ